MDKWIQNLKFRNKAENDQFITVSGPPFSFPGASAKMVLILLCTASTAQGGKEISRDVLKYA